MHLTDDDLVLHYYGEMTEAAEARACAHLETCAVCRESFARLKRVMAAIDAAPVPEPDAFFEQRTWARLEGAVREAPRPASAADDLVEDRPLGGRRSWLGGVPFRAIAWGAAAALVVIAAFVAGRFSSPPPAPVQQAAAAGAPLRERVLLVDLGDHLVRSENALVEFVSAPDPGEAAAGRQRIEELVAANRLYRRTAVASGDRAVAEVLDELERVLIEMAGAGPASSGDALDAVRRRIDARGLLFKVRVIRGQLQERVKEPARARAQDTTL